MRKLLNYLLLIAFCFGSTELSELIKFPQLLFHFNEHKSSNPQLSFDEFIVLHYGQHDDGDGDRPSDEKLPFKSSSKSNIVHFKETKILSSSTIEFSSDEFIVSIICSAYNEFLLSVDLKTILQPPRELA